MLESQGSVGVPIEHLPLFLFISWFPACLPTLAFPPCLHLFSVNDIHSSFWVASHRQCMGRALVKSLRGQAICSKRKGVANRKKDIWRTTSFKAQVCIISNHAARIISNLPRWMLHFNLLLWRDVIWVAYCWEHWPIPRSGIVSKPQTNQLNQTK